MPQFRPFGRDRAVCPYYLLDSHKSISCVFADEAAESVMQKFATEEEKRRFMRRHCFVFGGAGCKWAAYMRKSGM